MSWGGVGCVAPFLAISGKTSRVVEYGTNAGTITPVALDRRRLQLRCIALQRFWIEGRARRGAVIRYSGVWLNSMRSSAGAFRSRETPVRNRGSLRQSKQVGPSVRSPGVHNSCPKSMSHIRRYHRVLRLPLTACWLGATADTSTPTRPPCDDPERGGATGCHGSVHLFTCLASDTWPPRPGPTCGCASQSGSNRTYCAPPGTTHLPLPL